MIAADMLAIVVYVANFKKFIHWATPGFDLNFRLVTIQIVVGSTAQISDPQKFLLLPR